MSDALIHIENISKSYGTGNAATKALNDVNLKINRGAWVAIMGPSGHGKSTLLQIMGGLDQPTAGKVYLNATELTTLSAHDLAKTRAHEIGFVFQFFNLLPHLTVLENIQVALWFGGKSSDTKTSRAVELLSAVGLSEKANLFPGMLSGGQQQRVAIARALANNPDILLMDEPTGNLDSVAEDELMQLLKRLHANGKTIVMVTHNAAVACHAQQIVKVKDGRIENTSDAH